MERYQVQLDEDTASDLRAIARQRGVSFSQVVREAVVAYAAHQPSPSAAEAWASAIGCGHDIEGRTDTSQRHDDLAWDH